MQHKHLIEETEELLLDFNKLPGGIIPVAVQDIDSKEVILIAYTNQMALNESIKSGIATFWSTSRNELWVKGATSGQYFDLVEVFVNCEQNSIVYKVKPRKKGICHTKNKAGEWRNCFYRRLNFNTLKLENINP